MIIDQIKQDVREKLSSNPHRLKHVLGVYETAVKLAVHHHVDADKVSIAALFHDYMKLDDIETQKKYASKEQLKSYKHHPVMFHAISASEVLQEKYHIQDVDIIHAIKHHVWGEKAMSQIEKIVFISDYCEPNRDFFDTKYIFNLALKDLDEATLYCMKLTLEGVLSKRKKPHRAQLLAYIYYLEVFYEKTQSNY